MGILLATPCAGRCLLTVGSLYMQRHRDSSGMVGNMTTRPQGDMRSRLVAAFIACVTAMQLASAATVWPSGSIVMLKGGSTLVVRD